MRKIAIRSLVNNHGPVRNRILPTNPYVHTEFWELEPLESANRDTKLLCQSHSLIQPVGNTRSYPLNSTSLLVELVDLHTTSSIFSNFAVHGMFMSL